MFCLFSLRYLEIVCILVEIAIEKAGNLAEQIKLTCEELKIFSLSSSGLTIVTVFQRDKMTE